MFEKEAEEYVIKKHNIDITKQPVDFSLRCEFADDFTDFQQGAMFGYNKANEWHILAEEPDVLPKERQKVKVLTEEGNIENSTYYYDTYYEEFAWSNIGLLKVFAWKEIVLPELKESE